MRFFGNGVEGLLKGVQCDTWGGAVVKEDLLCVCRSGGFAGKWRRLCAGGKECVLMGVVVICA